MTPPGPPYPYLVIPLEFGWSEWQNRVGMKEKVLFFLVVFVILGVLAVIAWFTPLLFDLGIPEPPLTRPAFLSFSTSGGASLATWTNVVEMTVAPSVGRPSMTRPPAPPLPAGALSSGRTPAKEWPVLPQQPGIGQVVLIHGTVTATDTSLRRRALAPDGRVFAHEAIETAPGSRLRLRLDDGSELHISENSHLVLDEYLLDRSNAARTHFLMRLVKGFCRLIPGAIAELNPNRFQVHTRLSTIGIRGCEVAVRCRPDVEEIAVLALALQRSVCVEVASDGSPVRNILTAKPIPIEAARRVTLDVTEPHTVVLLMPGRAPALASLAGEKLRDLIREFAPFPEARYEVIQRPDAAVVTVLPDSTAPALPRSMP